jgi:hypothetical protein
MSASKEKLKRLLEEKQRRVCSVSLATFIKEAWHVIEPETELLWNYHLDCICDDLEYISRALIGETPPELPIRDVYNVPPRYMKSIAISIMWPVWEWGPFGVPWSRWLFGSYDMGLATDHSVARRTIIESEWYQRRWGHLFTLSTDQNVKTQFANNRRGVMRATSVGGGKIGRGGHRVVLDDPHDPEKILSDDTRERDVRVFRQGFTTRLDDKRRGAIVIVMQRLHEQDISATAESLGYRVVAFDNPCQEDTTITTRAGRVIERKAGEILWPAREDREQVESMRRVLGPFGFAGQYLQRPSPAGGVIFQREWWKFYRVRPAKFDAVAISIDETFDPIIDAQRAALDAARAQKKRHADPLLAAERHGKLLMRTFDDELQRLADDEQRRADAAELARAHDDRLEEAFEAEVAGRHEAAEIILQTPVITAPVVVTKTTPKIDGITHKPNWKGVCTDLAKLVLAAAAELVNPDRTRPRLAFSMLQAKQSEITKQAKALKHELNRVPGMRAWDEKTTSVKA